MPAVETLEWADGLGVTDLGLEHTLVDADVVAGARARGLTLGAWTPNDEFSHFCSRASVIATARSRQMDGGCCTSPAIRAH